MLFTNVMLIVVALKVSFSRAYVYITGVNYDGDLEVYKEIYNGTLTNVHTATLDLPKPQIPSCHEMIFARIRITYVNGDNFATPPRIYLIKNSLNPRDIEIKIDLYEPALDNILYDVKVKSKKVICESVSETEVELPTDDTSNDNNNKSDFEMLDEDHSKKDYNEYQFYADKVDEDKVYEDQVFEDPVIEDSVLEDQVNEDQVNEGQVNEDQVFINQVSESPQVVKQTENNDYEDVPTTPSNPASNEYMVDFEVGSGEESYLYSELNYGRL